jgi:hypothetical protein
MSFKFVNFVMIISHKAVLKIIIDDQENI